MATAAKGGHDAIPPATLRHRADVALSHQLAAYASDLRARFIRCKAAAAAAIASGDGVDVDHVPPQPPLPPPDLPHGAVYGRILSSRDLATKTRVHDDANMDFVFTFGPDSLTELGAASSLWHQYMAFGVPADRLVDNLLARGERPVLMFVALPDGGHRSSGGDGGGDGGGGGRLLRAYPATWDGVAAIVETTYPRAAEAVKAHLPAFQAGGRELFDACERAVPADSVHRFDPEDGAWARGRGLNTEDWFHPLRCPSRSACLCTWNVFVAVYCRRTRGAL